MKTARWPRWAIFIILLTPLALLLLTIIYLEIRRITDRTAPIITVLGENPVTVILGMTYADEGATAFDDRDGILTPNIKTNADDVDIALAGFYTVIYTVKDRAGNLATARRTVNVVTEITAVKINPLDQSSLFVGELRQFTTDIFPPETPLVWTSSNLAIGVIDINGLFTAIAPGTAEIIVFAGAATDTIKVVVNPRPTLGKVADGRQRQNGTLLYFKTNPGSID